MPAPASLDKNLQFWHWYPELLVQGLSDDQLRWQPPDHDSSIIFALWHAYRSEDDILHNLVFKRPSVFASQGWAQRLPVVEAGVTGFGNGLKRDQIGRIRLDIGEVLAYAKAVGERIGGYTASMTPDEAAEDVPLPFFASVYPMLDSMTKAEVVPFFAIGHVSEHLGEVQFLKGLMGMKGAPL